jgi:hypothetical protein
MKNGFGYSLSFFIFISLNVFCNPVFANQTKGSDTEGQAAGFAVLIWVAAAFLIGLIAGGFLIYYYSRSKIYSILSAEREKYLHDLKLDTRQDPLLREIFQYIGIVGILKKSKDKKVKAINNSEKKIAELRVQNVKLKSEYKNKISDAARKDHVIDFPQGSSDEQENNSDIKTEIYFTIPESDGSFKNINARKIKEIDCFYKIEPDDDCQRGKLYFVSGEYDLRALDNIDYYLSPVCEIQNISDRSKARKIQMTGTGSVIKKGGSWIIDGKDKVKIKLVE